MQSQKPTDLFDDLPYSGMLGGQEKEISDPIVRNWQRWITSQETGSVHGTDETPDPRRY